MEFKGMELKFILESLLFSAQKPVSIKELRDLLSTADRAARRQDRGDSRRDRHGVGRGRQQKHKADGNAGLYRFDRSGVAKLMDGVMTANGLAFSPDGRTLYFSDTPRFAAQGTTSSAG